MPTRAQMTRGGDALLSLALLGALVAASLPLLRVLAGGLWVATGLFVVCSILAVGVVLRRLRAPAIVTTIAELVVAVALVTLFFFSGSAVLGIIPTPATFAELPTIAAAASQQIVEGIAPVAVERPLAALVVSAVAALAILLDHTVVTARMPLLATVALVAVWLIPALAVPARTDVAAFVVLAVSALLLIRAETRSRERATLHLAAGSVSDHPEDAGAPTRRSGAAAAVTATVAVAAILAAVVITPELPRPAPRAGVGTGPATTINANLELGDDLRRPVEVEVLSTRTNAPTMPYLRAATLSQFDGDVWEPDRGDTVPLSPEALGPVTAGPDIRVTEYLTTVTIDQLNSPWLPIPGPAVRVDDLAGSWEAMPANRTVVAADAATPGQEYLTTTHVVRPTLEQIQAAGTTTEGLSDALTALPDDMPDVIAETASEITADAANDYDRLAALQRWFRSAAFSYSLDAPVSDGFDGSGVDAIADFLDERAGYCVHFASAFAVMARTLGMPSRIVIGYLPGTLTGASVDDQSVATVSSSQLHAWPEVNFAGIGWVQFEPTNSLGAPQTYTRSTQPVPADGGQDVTEETAPEEAAPLAPEDAPSPTPTASAPAGTAAGESPIAVALPYAGVVVGVIVLLLIPALVGAFRRRLQLAAAGRGDVLAAWRFVRESARDIGEAVPASESPRALGARLAAYAGVPEDRVESLVGAVERASFGRHADRVGRAPGRAAASDARAIRAALLASVSSPRRTTAVLLPRAVFTA
ncbi:transglutaminase family protein [Microbacterium radiodurans]|nr:DUF3488 and transglutaminase-like domain-containing protein [Microbacterium radiodurans]